MTVSAVLVFVSTIVGACIVGGAAYAGLSKIAKALNDKTTQIS